MQLQQAAQEFQEFRAWIHLADFGGKNMDGWSHPPEELEKSFSRSRGVGLTHFWEKKTTLKNIPVCWQHRETPGSRRTLTLSWDFSISWEIFKSPLGIFNFWIYFRRVWWTFRLSAGLHVASPLGSVCLNEKKAIFTPVTTADVVRGEWDEFDFSLHISWCRGMECLSLDIRYRGWIFMFRGAFVGNLI